MEFKCFSEVPVVFFLVILAITPMYSVECIEPFQKKS